MSVIIETKQIHKHFNRGKANQVHAVRDISLSVPAATTVLIKGPSGSGKTTLLAILGCLSRPTSGHYSCLAQDVSHWSEKFLTTFRRNHIGIIFQNFNLINGFTVRQNIALPLLPLGLPYQTLQEKVQRAAELVHITHRLEFNVQSLSGGEAQRTAIARALINQPEILLADEPTAHLDTRLAQTILELFDALKKQGKTIIMASHDPLVENHAMIDKIYCLRDGGLERGDVC